MKYILGWNKFVVTAVCSLVFGLSAFSQAPVYDYNESFCTRTELCQVFEAYCQAAVKEGSDSFLFCHRTGRWEEKWAVRVYERDEMIILHLDTGKDLLIVAFCPNPQVAVDEFKANESWENILSSKSDRSKFQTVFDEYLVYAQVGAEPSYINSLSVCFHNVVALMSH